MSKRAVGWYVWAKNPGALPKAALVSGCFETRDGAETFQQLYERIHQGSEPYIEEHVLTEAQNDG